MNQEKWVIISPESKRYLLDISMGRPYFTDNIDRAFHFSSKDKVDECNNRLFEGKFEIKKIIQK